MGPIRQLASRVGRLACALGWHRQPYEVEPRPPDMTHEDYRFHRRHRCGRCGLSGRIDGHGNLESNGLA